jgi:glycosyltransferase involved in cell wall biosynthesis
VPAEARASLGLAQPYHNPHLAEAVAEAARIRGWNLRLLAFAPPPSFRKDNAWAVPASTTAPRGAIRRCIVCIQWLLACDRYIFLGLGDPFPAQPLLLLLACLSGRPVFLASEGFKHTRASPGLRAACALLSLFGNAHLLAIGNTAATDFSRAGLSWPARQFGFTEEPPGEFVPRSSANCDSPIRLLVVGQLIPRKRVDWLMRELGRHPSRADIELMVCGAGPERGNLESLGYELGLKTRFLGFRRGTELAEVFNAADVFIHPAAYEGWGVVLNHALYFGLPILAHAPVRSARGLLVHEGINGYVFADGPEFSRHLSQLVGDAALRGRFSCHSRRLYAFWSVAAIARSLAIVLADSDAAFARHCPLSNI